LLFLTTDVMPSATGAYHFDNLREHNYTMVNITNMVNYLRTIGFESFGETEKEAGDYAEDIAAQMLASSLGVKFDIDKSWNEKRKQWKISGEIYKTRNITQSAIGDPKGRWTTVFAAAVLIL